MKRCEQTYRVPFHFDRADEHTWKVTWVCPYCRAMHTAPEVDLDARRIGRNYDRMFRDELGDVECEECGIRFEVGVIPFPINGGEKEHCTQEVQAITRKPPHRAPVDGRIGLLMDDE